MNEAGAIYDYDDSWQPLTGDDYDILQSVADERPPRAEPRWEAVVDMDLAGQPVKPCGCGASLCPQHAQVRPRARR